MQDLVRIETMNAADLAHLAFWTSVDSAQLQLMVLSAKLTPEQPMPADTKHWDLLAGFAAEHAATDGKTCARTSKLAQDSGHDDAAAMATATRAAGAEALKDLARKDVTLAETRGRLLLLVLVPCTLGRWALMSVDSCDAARAPPPLLGPSLVSFVDPTVANRDASMEHLATRCRTSKAKSGPSQLR